MKGAYDVSDRGRSVKEGSYKDPPWSAEGARGYRFVSSVEVFRAKKIKNTRASRHVMEKKAKCDRHTGRNFWKSGNKAV